MTEIQALKERHSVRNYTEKKIEAEKVAELNKLIAQLNEEGYLNLQFIEDQGKTFNKLLNKFMGLGSAPSVIACVGPDDPTLDERVGYYGQKLVLAAQMMGLNTCWAGTFNRNTVPAKIGEGERIAIVIAIGYGATQGKVRKTKSAEEVSNCKADSPEWFKKGVEAAMLAPTAINQQKFNITLKDDETVDFSDLGGVLSKIDLGIVKYNFEVGSKA
ncbi:MAG: nitroreductase [Clostridia bacterium]|nr:nitroreductase [Clostridia bacterium]